MLEITVYSSKPNIPSDKHELRRHFSFGNPLDIILSIAFNIQSSEKLALKIFITSLIANTFVSLDSLILIGSKK